MSPAARRRVLILSPDGLAADAERARPALEALAEAGLETEVQALRDATEDALRAAIDAADIVIAAGGDGTVRSVAGLVRGPHRPLGLLPLGTANDFARTLGLNGDLLRAAHAIAGGRTARADLGLINGMPFLNVASFGLSARVHRRLDRSSKSLWGPLSYARAGLGVLVRRRVFGLTLRIDGEEHRLHVIQAGIANGRFQGGGAVVHPEAGLHDGMLHVYAIEQRSLLQLLVMALSVKTQGHRWWKGVHLFEGRRVEVFTALPLDISVDGDLIATTPAVCEVAAGALDVFIPEDFASPA